MLNKLCIVTIFVLLSAGPGYGGQMTCFDAADDFSATNNPNGTWSYGWSSAITSNFNPYPDHYENSYGLDLWVDNGHIFSDTPNVLHNGTDGVIVWGGTTWQPGQFSIHPGFNGEYSHARWTAPYAGVFTIAAEFTGLGTNGAAGTTTDVHVLQNSIGIFEDYISGYGDMSSFSAIVSANMGDEIDFAVGYGSNLNFSYDTTALSATICLVPEPATVCLLALGGLCLIRRKK